jgi:hypothetical protein
MNSQELVNAIKYINPEAEFSFTNGDLDTIVWDKPKSGYPIKEEILAAVEPAKAKAQADLDAAEAAKEAAKGKLTLLGLTADDLKALGL